MMGNLLMGRADKIRIFILSAVCVVLIACKGDVETGNDRWADFYGTFKGSAESVLSGELSERELEVVIKPWEEKGFTVEWTTLIHRASGEKKVTDLSIDFYPAERPGILASAMQTNVFGQSVPYDPVAKDADPYVWAGIDGNTLTVRALYIVDGGGYEMHEYKRSLSDTGLTLDFQRLSNGEKVTQVSAQLDAVN